MKNLESDEELEWNLSSLGNLKKKLRAKNVWTHIKTWNMDVVMHKSQFFEPIDKKVEEYGDLYKLTPIQKLELSAAVHYDNTVHPDQVVFVTTDVKLAHAANWFFGSDSIIIV